MGAKNPRSASCGSSSNASVERAGHCFLEAHVDSLAAAASLSLEECEQRANHGKRGGGMIGLQAETLERRLVRKPVGEDHAARRLRDQIRGSKAGVRTGQAE